MRKELISVKNARILLISGGASFLLAILFSLIGLMNLYGSASCDLTNAACQTGVVKLPITILLGQELMYASFVLVAIAVYFISRTGTKSKRSLRPIKSDVRPVALVLLVGIISGLVIASLLNPALDEVPKQALLIASFITAALYPLCALAALYYLDAYQHRKSK